MMMMMSDGECECECMYRQLDQDASIWFFFFSLLAMSCRSRYQCKNQVLRLVDTKPSPQIFGVRTIKDGEFSHLVL